VGSVHKVAVITGAGTGIGRAVSLALYSAAYSVVLAGRRSAELEKTAAAASPTGERMLPVPTDVSKPESVRTLFRTPETRSAVSMCCSIMQASTHCRSYGGTDVRAVERRR
jgi:NAD(P)-dependent dehydrogenase (short-subunit alcohol dehydrogenase family)